MMISIVYGNEPYLIDREKHKICDGLTVPEMNFFRGSTFNKEVLDFLRTYPMMDTRRVAYLDINKMSDLDTPEFSQYLEKPIATSDLFILIRNFDGRTKLAKSLKETGYLKVLDKLTSEGDVSKVIMYELKHNNARITGDAMSELLRRENYLENEGTNLLSIVSDLNTLCAIDKDITKGMVEAYVSEHENANTFLLADLIKKKDLKNLAKQAELIGSDTREMLGALALVLRQYRIAWKLNFCELKGIKFVTFRGMDAQTALKGIGICQDAIDSVKNGTCVSECLLMDTFLKLTEI